MSLSRMVWLDLDSHLHDLTAGMEQHLSVPRTVRSELRRNSGHKKANTEVLISVEHAERIERRFSNICHRYVSFHGLVEFARTSPSSLEVFFTSTSDFVEKEMSMASFAYVREELFGKITDKIMGYLDDPRIRRIGFYGRDGLIKHGITEHFMNRLSGFFDKIVRVKLLGYMLMENLRDIASQVGVGLREDEDAEDLVEDEDAEDLVYRISLYFKYTGIMCLFIFDGVDDGKLDLLHCFGMPNIKRVAETVYKVNSSLRYLYNLYPLYKLQKNVIKLVGELSQPRIRDFSWRVLYYEDGADRVPQKFASQKILTGKLGQEVSDNIWEFLSDPMIGTIGLYGDGGVGKTTMIKNICSELVNSDTFNPVIWVSLCQSRHLSDYNSLQDEIALQLGIRLMASQTEHDRAILISEKLKTLKKYLLVLDGMWEPISLSKLGIPLRRRGCKIVLTTRSWNVCWKMQVDRPLNVAPLSNEEAWDLFVSKSGDRILDPEIKSLAKDIVHECGGLPITVVTLCHALRDAVNTSAWRLALTDLRSTSNRSFSEGKIHVYDVLKFAYRHLKNDQVRKCFLCCAIFPDDYKFDSSELIQYWIVEDFLHNEGGIVESINDGLEILKELTDANMLETITEGGIERFKMHDLFRDLAIITMNKELCFFVKAGVGLTYFAGTGNEKISLIGNQISRLEIFNHPCTNMSTLLLRDNPLCHVSCSFFNAMPNLQVLDMSYSGMRKWPTSLSKLRKLRVLFLKFCTGLEELPSFGNFEDLEFLSLCGTLIRKLPPGINRLVKLRSLDLSSTIRLECIQDGVISSLSNLEELHLQGSRLCKMKPRKVANCLKEIRCLKKLGILTLSAIGFEDHLDTILHLQSHSLKSFSINAYGSTQDYNEDL